MEQNICRYYIVCKDSKYHSDEKRACDGYECQLSDEPFDQVLFDRMANEVDRIEHNRKVNEYMSSLPEDMDEWERQNAYLNTMYWDM